MTAAVPASPRLPLKYIKKLRRNKAGRWWPPEQPPLFPAFKKKLLLARQCRSPLSQQKADQFHRGFEPRPIPTWRNLVYKKFGGDVNRSRQVCMIYIQPEALRSRTYSRRRSKEDAKTRLNSRCGSLICDILFKEAHRGTTIA